MISGHTYYLHHKLLGRFGEFSQFSVQSLTGKRQVLALVDATKHGTGNDDRLEYKIDEPIQIRVHCQLITLFGCNFSLHPK